MTTTPSLTALALVCTLKPGPADSSTDLISRQVLTALSEHGVVSEAVRVVDHDVKPGVELDMGDGDAWPEIRARLMRADILVLATPTWVGDMSSVARRVIERLDAELSEKDEQGRTRTFGKVAIAAVVGNEDGAHHISANLFQALNDVGFSLPAQAVTYWNGEAMQAVDYKDLPSTPEKTAQTNATVAAHAAHLARLLKQSPYPPVS